MPSPNHDLAVGQVLEVKLVFSQQLQIALNILHYRVVSEVVVTGHCQDVEVAQSFSSAINGLYTPVMNSISDTEGATVQIIKPAPLPFSFVAGQSGGTATGDPMSKQTCGIITKLTAGTGRKRRGRMYIPFPSEDENDVDSRPTAGYLTLLGTLASGLLNPFSVIGIKGTATIQPVIYDRVAGTTIDITGFTVRNKWATQRRRGDYGAKGTVPWDNVV